MTRRLSFLLVLLSFSACRRTELSREPVRLVDRFAEASVLGTPVVEIDIPRTEWTFDGSDPTPFTAVRGSEIRLDNGDLRGRSTSSSPVLVAERTHDVPDEALLYAVEVRARVTDGTRMSVYFDEGPELVLARAMADPLDSFSTPIQPGDETRTYVMRATSARRAATLERILLVPTDTAGAEFSLESVRMVFRREHLTSIPSGVGWHGMSEIYRETIVSRAPESIRFELTLPENARLELAVATSEAMGAQFSIDVTPLGSDDTRHVSDDVAKAHVWRELTLDLDDLEGESVELTLSVQSEAAGTLGFWGAPVVRSGSLSSPETPRGVILVITDTLRSDHLPFHGYARPTAPTLQRLGDEGVRFLDAVSQATWTKVSVSTLQTSLYPTTHTVAAVPDRLPSSATTLAEAYRAAGYRTWGIASIPFVGQFTNLHQGFEVYHENGSLERPFKTASETVDRLSGWLGRQDRGQFFALLHMADPHSPYRPPPEFETAFAEEGEMDRLDELVDRVKRVMPPGVHRFFGMATTEQLETASIDPDEYVRLERAGYDGSILGMDQALARLVDRLDELELTDDVVIAIVSDHGTEFLEHGRHFHGHSPYGELNRVPLLLWGPGFVPSAADVTQTVQTMDLMPTLLDLSGVAVPDGAQGLSLRPLFDRAGARRRELPAITEALSDDGAHMTSLISNGWKLVRIVAAEQAKPRHELYDHVTDPLNFDNIAQAHPERVLELSAQLDAWQKFAEAARLDDAAVVEAMDAAELERLRSLGYIQ